MPRKNQFSLWPEVANRHWLYLIPRGLLTFITVPLRIIFYPFIWAAKIFLYLTVNFNSWSNRAFEKGQDLWNESRKDGNHASHAAQKRNALKGSKAQPEYFINFSVEKI